MAQLTISSAPTGDPKAFSPGDDSELLGLSSIMGFPIDVYLSQSSRDRIQRQLSFEVCGG